MKLKLLPFRSQKGNSVAFIIPILIAIVIITLLPVLFTTPTPTECRVGQQVDPLAEKSVFLPPIKNVGTPRGGIEGGWDESKPKVEYVVIRKNVPIFMKSNDPTYLLGNPDWNGRDSQIPPGSKLRWPVIADTEFLGRNADTRHTMLYSNANQAGFDVYYPNMGGEVELPFLIKDRNGETNTQTHPNQSILTLRTEGFLIFVHLDEKGDPIKINYGPHIYYLIDLYQDKELYLTPDEKKGYKVDDIFHCLDPDAPADPKFIDPEQNRSADKEQLQLEWFLLQGGPGMYVHCKPAVYLYPEQQKLVNIQVFPKGELSYTDPPYDKVAGWTVSANQNGRLTDLNGNVIPANYIYYETKLLDQYIKKPQKGWVAKKSELENLFNEILPELGLNQKESNDFKSYWLNKLPESPYYFVGLVDKTQRDFLEPLSVTPSPDTEIRFSFYFEPLENYKLVEQPIIETPKREGFTLVDWGGLIKLHKGTPFTCSQ